MYEKKQHTYYVYLLSSITRVLYCESPTTFIVA